jgi:hypothetical protein
MVTALPDAVCVAFGFHSSIDASKLCVFNNFTAKHLLQDGSPNYMCKGKAIPLQAWTGPEGSRRLRFPDFMTIGP